MSAFKLVLLSVVLFAASAVAQQAGKSLGPTYVLTAEISVTPTNNADRQARNYSTMGVFSNQTYFEWESFDGWYNNPAHPEWGGAGKCVDKSSRSRSVRLEQTLHGARSDRSYLRFFPPLSLFVSQICLWKGRHQLCTQTVHMR